MTNKLKQAKRKTCPQILKLNLYYYIEIEARSMPFYSCNSIFILWSCSCTLNLRLLETTFFHTLKIARLWKLFLYVLTDLFYSYVLSLERSSTMDRKES